MAEKESKWIKFCPSLELPKERVSIAYDTHDERGYRFAYGYFQFYNGTCGCFWKDGNEQPKVVKSEDIKYWMPVPSLDVQEEPSETKSKCMYTNDNYTDEDRKVLCDGCEEDCNVSEIDFEQELYKAFGRVNDFTLGMQIAKRFYEMGRNHQEPVSDDLEKIVEEIAEPTILNAYGTKELARRLRNTILCGTSVSEDLGEYINELSKQFPEVSFAKLSRIAVRVAKWQKEQDQETIELAEDHAMLAGMEKMKEQMIAKAIDAQCFGFQGAALFSFRLPSSNYLVGSEVKVIVIKK